MRQVGKLRASLVFFLAFALLVGPCLSISGLSGLGPGHIHQASDNPEIHAASGAREHAAAQAQPAHHVPTKLAKTGKPETPPSNCEDVCDSWARHKAQRLLAAVSSDEPIADAVVDGPDVYALVPVSPKEAGSYASAAPAFHVARHDAWQPVFAATNRYRL